MSICDDGADRAVVVGASGGIGAALVRALSKSGRYAQIVGVVRRTMAQTPACPCSIFLEADLECEDQIARAADTVRRLGGAQRVIVATGLLHEDGLAPEKSMHALDAAALKRLFAVNAIGPALVAKHFLPLARRDIPSVFAALTARVGSIADNRLGGWYGYRASKAALNQMIATLAVEHRRTHPMGVCVALHPGTVDTRLSAPFQGGRASQRLTPDQSAQALLAVIDGLKPTNSGGFFAWNGQAIPW